MIIVNQDDDIQSSVNTVLTDACNPRKGQLRQEKSNPGISKG